jgi:predicted metalloprotease
MKWSGRRSSEIFEDRRGMSSGGKTIVGGGIGIIILLLNTFGGENVKCLSTGTNESRKWRSNGRKVTA